MDGARIFNAAVAQGLKAAELARYAEFNTVLPVKKDYATVGSLLVGTSDFIARGTPLSSSFSAEGMRQAGVIAAAGIVALTTMVGPPERGPCERTQAGRGNCWYKTQG